MLKLEEKSDKILKQYYKKIKLSFIFLDCLIENVSTNIIKMY